MSLTDLFVHQAAAMPAMPEVAVQLLTVLDGEQFTLGELAALIARDQALSTKVLRVANSAYYAHGREITTLNNAAAVLGARKLRDLALTVCLIGAFPVIPGFDRLAFWRGTLAVATYAQVMAPELDLSPDTAYLGGLMLRTGQALMALVEPQAVAEINAQSLGVDGRIAAETARLGCSHPEVTADLARHWHFPVVLVQAFGAALDPQGVLPFSPLGAVLRIASVVCDCRELQVPLASGLAAAHAELVAGLGLDADWLEAHLPDHRLAMAGAETFLH